MAVALKYGLMVLVSTLLGMALCTSAQAQKLYRCGSTFQDRPCESGESGKTVRDFSRSPDASASVNPVADPVCAKRGVDAQRIAWGRESGKTADAQTAEASNDEQVRLIAEVYNRQGSAVDIRNAVQAKCMEEKAQAAQAAALLAATLKAQGAAPAASAPNSVPVNPDTAAPQQAAPADNKNRCDNLKAQLATIRARQRAGGSAQTMNSLSQQQQTLEQSARDAGC